MAHDTGKTSKLHKEMKVNIFDSTMGWSCFGGLVPPLFARFGLGSCLGLMGHLVLGHVSLSRCGYLSICHLQRRNIPS
jgi:hypothetical protein